MPFIIDGHNLIPKIPGLSLNVLDDEEALIKLLQSYCRENKKNVEVYFDNAPPGQPRKRQFGRVTTFFIRQGTTADSAIRSRLRNLKRSAQNWTVVTSDREVMAAAREAHSQVISSEEFANSMLNTVNSDVSIQEKEEDVFLSPDAVEDWLNIFNDDATKK